MDLRFLTFAIITSSSWLTLTLGDQLPPGVNQDPDNLIHPLVSPPTPIERDDIDYGELDDIPSASDALDSSEDIYASEFPYDQPLQKFSVNERADRATSRQGRAHVRIIHKWAGSPKNYAKKYKTWMPSKEWMKPVRTKGRPKRMRPPNGKQGRRRGGPPNRRRKVQPPFAGNHLRRPSPPPEPEYDYISEEEYFPEETKRNEYQSQERRPYRKHGPRRRPGSGLKEEKYHHSSEDYPSVSYSNFVHHPAPSSNNYDYVDFLDNDTKLKERRRKKKKRKHHDRKKGHHRNEDQFGATSESIEEASHQRYERFPPYPDEQSLKRPSRQPHPQPTQATPIFGEGYLGTNNLRNPQNVHINRGGVNTGGLGNFRNDFNQQPTQSFSSQAYETNNYNNFGVSNSNPQPDIITQQNYNQFVNQQYQGTGHQYAVQNEQNFPVQPQSPQPAVNYQQPATNYNRPQQITNGHTLQSVVPTSRGNEYSSKYKSSSFFDNTETFQEFNRNVYNKQNSANTRPKQTPSFVPSPEYQEPAEDAENDFINRHLDLYSNGMNGVPVQGDGRNKDYDIGYGEIHYDESHRV